MEQNYTRLDLLSPKDRDWKIAFIQGNRRGSKGKGVVRMSNKRLNREIKEIVESVVRTSEEIARNYIDANTHRAKQQEPS